MSFIKPFGLFILGNPVLVADGELWFRDRCYAETISQTTPHIPCSLIVARTRSFPAGSACYPNLRDSGAQMAMELPDYGRSGLRGVVRLLNIVRDHSMHRRLGDLIRRAQFIYVEGGTSVESFLATFLAKRMNRRMILEMRGSTVLNRQYMFQRFGPLGLVLVPIHHAMLRYMRRQCLAGLYINKDLMANYPVAGPLRRAISDAYLPDNFGGLPRQFSESARKYIYVGHLETVKRVDLIIQALAKASSHLPVDWRLDIVGSGPLEAQLKSFVESLSITQHVTFHGRVQWGKPLVTFYRQADIALFASTTEGAQRTLVEAMAFGLPVIGTRVGNAPELLDPSVLIPVGDHRTYARQLAKIANNPKRLTIFSQRNWELAQNFRSNILEAKRREFWRLAIEMSCMERAR